MKIGVTNVVVVLMIRFDDGVSVSGSWSEFSAGERFELESSVGDGGSASVVEGGVATDIALDDCLLLMVVTDGVIR